MTNTDPIIDEDFLRRLENLKILARSRITGQEKGEHLSWRSGPSLEFLDYRRYQFGDDFRYVDWNVFGRLDKLFIKLFRAEETQVIHILMDMSRSMGYGKPSKDICTKKITAALSYIGLTHLDNVRITAFRDRLDDSLAPLKSGLAFSRILDYLLSVQPGGKTDLNTCLSKYADRRTPSGIAVILSDLMDPNGFEKGLDALRRAQSDVSLIQILDHREIFPTDTGNLILQEVETGNKLNIGIDRSILDLYHEKFREFLDRVHNFCSVNEIDYYLWDTGNPFEELLLEYISSGRIFQRYESAH